MNIAKHKEGIQFTLENSSLIFQSGVCLSINKLYSPAIALLILSSEEIIKSFALCLEILLGDASEVKKIIKNSNTKVSNAYLFNHVEKHKLIYGIITDLEKIKFISKLSRLFSKGSIKEFIDFISLPFLEQLKYNDLLANIEKFNEIKNSCLYVDYKGNTWQTPLKFNEIEFNKIYHTVKLLNSIFIPKIEYFLRFSNEDLIVLSDAFEM